MGPSRAFGIELELLGGVRLVIDGDEVTVPTSAERLLAYVALASPSSVRRCRVAGELWPEANTTRAAANLRSALWRLRRCHDGLVQSTGQDLRLSPRVWLDLDHLASQFADDAGRGRRACLASSLLPGWYDEWLLTERERVRQAMLHALEAACRRMIDTDDHGGAIDLGLQAISAEPLRESAHRLVIEAHLAEGNRNEALAHLDNYARTLERELGIAPSPSLQRLVADQLIHV